MNKINLLDFDEAGLERFFVQQGEKSYRATQVFKWIHQQGHCDFTQMSNLSKSLREWLMDTTEIKAPEIVLDKISLDGTRKWVLRLFDNNCIEMVYIPEDDRGTLCVSSQVGCALNCSFCSTGKQGFSRDLSVAEIIGQVFIAARCLSKANGAHDKHVTNVVMMGMGEPLLNFDNVVTAMGIMMADNGYGLSKRRVTLSTSGIVPAMEKLSQISPVALAVSLHAPNDELRNELVPVNRKYNLAQLMDMCRRYFENEPRRVVTFEYTMLNEVNDKPEHAKQLIKLLANVPCKINLIPYNSIPGVHYRCSTPERIETFRNILMKAGFNTITRKTRGDDIDAACGQLVGEVNERTKRQQQWREKLQQEVE